MHTGEPTVSGQRYVGLGVHRAARICAAARGGQVLLSRRDGEPARRGGAAPALSVRRGRRARAQGLRAARAGLRARRRRPPRAARDRRCAGDSAVRPSPPDRSAMPCGWWSPTTRCCCARASAACCATPASRSSARLGTARSCCGWRASRIPTSPSSTSGCRRPTPTRACAPPASCAPSCPDVGVLVLSQYVDAGSAIELLSETQDGIGYLLKDRVRGHRGLRRVGAPRGARRTALDAAVVGQLVGRRRVRDPLADLTPRERDVLQLMAQGHDNEAIAAPPADHAARGGR